MGKRLGELTKGNTKCMVPVNNVLLIDRMLSQLDRLALSKIVVVIGYQGEKLRQHIGQLNISTPVHYVENPIYDKTNNIYSLALAQDYLQKEDTILLESDLIFEDGVLEKLLKSPEKNLALVAKYQPWMDGTMVRIDEKNNIINFVPKSAFRYSDISSYYKTVNIYKFSKEFSQKYHDIICIPFSV